jgi:hypothetical protein
MFVTLEGILDSVKSGLLHLAGQPNSQKSDKRHDIQHNDSPHNDIQHNDIQHNDIQHNDTQHSGFVCYTQHKRH